MALPSKRIAASGAVVCLFIFLMNLLYHSPFIHYRALPLQDLTVEQNPRRCNDSIYIPANVRTDAKAFVVASMKHEDTTWLDQVRPDWERYNYVVDDPTANFTVPANKGREAMVFLSFIIDHYENLPEIMVFLHASQYQWHNEDPFYDGVPMLQRLRTEHVLEKGYNNLRCTWELGCPATLRPSKTITKIEAALEPNNERANTDASYAKAYRELFLRDDVGDYGSLESENDVPEEIGAPCGAQFAVTAKQVHRRPICDYLRYRNWLLETPLPDAVSGRIFEVTWHIIFGMPAIDCPLAQTCFCEQYGLCDLACTDGACKGRYWAPPRYQIPDQWPLIGPGTNGLPPEGWWEK